MSTTQTSNMMPSMSQEAWRQCEGRYPNSDMKQMTATDGFRQSVLPTMTQNTFFSQTNQGFGHSNLDGLDSEQLKERLLVAETLMKKLYTRNKELEDFHQNAVHFGAGMEERTSILDGIDANPSSTFNIEKPITTQFDHVGAHSALSQTIRNGLNSPNAN